MKFASENLRNDLYVVLKAIQNHGGAYTFAGEVLKRDFEVALAATRRTKEVFQWDVPYELKPDIIAWFMKRIRYERLFEKHTSSCYAGLTI